MMHDHDEAYDAAPMGVHQLLAVTYAFASWEGGERQLVNEEAVSASTLAMFLPLLDAMAKRTRVDQAPGIIIFDNYQDARQAAQTLGSVAAQVTIQKVEPTPTASESGWTGSSGKHYQPRAGALPQVVKA